MTTPGADGTVDGRSARRERNRLAALDAAFELFGEGQALPSIEDIAARSGVSLRSLYRYFADAHELHLLALARRAEVAEPMYHLDHVGEGPLAERVDHLVAQRMRLYDEAAPAIRMALAIAPTLPAIKAQVEIRKKQLGDQLRDHFAPELEPLPAERRASVLACVEALCLFESVELLRVEHGLSSARARETLADGLLVLLSSAPRG